MNAMKADTMTFIGNLYRRVAAGLGLAESDVGKTAGGEISEEARQKARMATKAIRAVTERYGLHSTRDEVLELVRSGRR